MKYLGLTLIVVGVIILLVSYLAHLTHLHMPLLLGLFLIVGGAIAHIVTMKRDSRY